MSRLLGKLLGYSLPYCKMKYIKSSDKFEFEIGRRNAFKVSRSFCECFCEVHNNLPFMYEWSIGYKTKKYVGKESCCVLRREEMNFIAKALDLKSYKELFLCDHIAADSDFDNLCVIMHQFCFSNSILKECKRQWKKENRWLNLKVREVCDFRSRSHRVDSSLVSASVSELERVERNKKLAKEKRLLAWWIDACKEECQLLHKRFDRKKCMEEWSI